MNSGTREAGVTTGSEPSRIQTVSRRGLLGRAAALGTGLAAMHLSPRSAEAAPPSGPATRKLKVVFTGGHPGDPEYGCGGTIARLTDLGHAATLLYLNEGDWADVSAVTRLAEARQACSVLKARPLYAGQRNGHAVVDEARYEAYRAILKSEEPDAVVTHWPLDNHRDHRAMAMLTFDAWRKSGRAFALYYYEVSDGEDTIHFSPTHYVDISSVEPRKRAACHAHASQTPERYYELQDLVARFRGLEGGYQRAEAFLLQAQSPNDPLLELTQRQRK